MPSSRRLGKVSIDPARVAADLARLEPAGYVDSYGEFVCGSWRTSMLWNASGETDDTRIRDYAGAAQLTDHGRKLGYIEELMTSTFNLDRLRFARITRLAPGTVVVPHVDYIELESDLVRIHVPLQTDPRAYASEEQTIYRMALGEAWFLDATRVHSIANFSEVNRLHLLLDFGGGELDSIFLPGLSGPETLPPDAVVPRRPLRPGEKDALLALSQVIDPTNFYDVVSILIRRYFVAELDARDVFTWLSEIAAASGDETVIAKAQWIEKHAVSSR